MAYKRYYNRGSYNRSGYNRGSRSRTTTVATQSGKVLKGFWKYGKFHPYKRQ